MVWAGVALLAGVVAPRAVEDERARGHDARAVHAELPHNFIPGADANDLILQARTWERHDVGHDARLRRRRRARRSRSIKVPLLYMPSETDCISPSATRATKRSSCRLCRSCRFRPCGDIRPGPARIPKTALSSTIGSPSFCRARHRDRTGFTLLRRAELSLQPRSS